MSLEAALAEHGALMKAHTEALNANTKILESVVAGQKAALEKLGDGKATPGTRATKKDEPKTTPPKDEPKPTAEESTGRVVTDDDLKKAGAALMQGKSKDDQGKIANTLKDMLEWMGLDRAAKLTGPEAKLTDAQRKQALFFIERWTAGLSVDFNADYDFDGPVDQGAEAAADGDADPFA